MRRIFFVNSIPNIISACRFLLAILMIICFCRNNALVAGIIYIVAAVTDILDGYIARRFNAVTKLGIMLDPLSDKFLQVSAMFCLSFFFKLPLIVSLTFAVKELVMIIGAIAIIKKGLVVQADFFGKAATLLQFIGILLAFSAYTSQRSLPYVEALMLALVFSFVSLFHYAKACITKL